MRSLTLALLLLPALGGCALPSARAATLETSLREEIHTVRVAQADASIVVTTFRPGGAGPFPWIVLSHGTAPTAAANRALGCYRPLAPVREWVQRGYAVVVPVRRGYGASGGDKFGDSYGSCARPDFRRAGEGAALDLLATVEWAKAQHATLDRRSGELLPLAGPDAALLAQRPTHRATYCASLAPDPDPGPAPDPSPAPDPALASAAAGQPCCAPCLAVSLAALATSAPVAHAGLPLAVAAASDAGLLGLPVEEGPRLPLEAVSVRQLEHSDEAAVAGLNAG